MTTRSCPGCGRLVDTSLIRCQSCGWLTRLRHVRQPTPDRTEALIEIAVWGFLLAVGILGGVILWA